MRPARHGALQQAPRRAVPARLAMALACVAVLAAVPAARAFTLRDGTTLRCYAAGEPVAEYDAPPQHPLVVHSHAGLVEPTGSGGYRITWNMAVLSNLPPDVHDFLFFHECAHASVPTQDELLANCVGLKTMRAAGRAGGGVEARLGAFYGRGSEYWQKTLECANADGNSPPAPPH